MSVYLVGAIDVHDYEEYKKYSAAAMAALAPFSFEMLSVDCDPKILEGKKPAGKLFIFKFKSQEEVDRFWASEEYRKAIGFRHAASETRFIMSMKGPD